MTDDTNSVESGTADPKADRHRPQAVRDLYRHLPRAAAVYSITCTATGEQYVGVSSNVRKRASIHLTHITTGRHASKKLIAAVAAHGLTSLRFDVLEQGEGIDSAAEHRWIENLRPTFNTHVGPNGDVSRSEVPLRQTRRPPGQVGVHITVRDRNARRTRSFTAYGVDLDAAYDACLHSLQKGDCKAM